MKLLQTSNNIAYNSYVPISKVLLRFRGHVPKTSHTVCQKHHSNHTINKSMIGGFLWIMKL